jgi:hypothetical protein
MRPRSNLSHRIGILGDSVGGIWLPLLTGQSDRRLWESQGFRFRVNAAVNDLYGPTTMAVNVFGTEQANPINW